VSLALPGKARFARTPLLRCRGPPRRMKRPGWTRRCRSRKQGSVRVVKIRKVPKLRPRKVYNRVIRIAVTGIGTRFVGTRFEDISYVRPIRGRVVGLGCHVLMRHPFQRIERHGHVLLANTKDASRSNHSNLRQAIMVHKNFADGTNFLTLRMEDADADQLRCSPVIGRLFGDSGYCSLVFLRLGIGLNC
jgi:hypothetical protein